MIYRLFFEVTTDDEEKQQRSKESSMDAAVEFNKSIEAGDLDQVRQAIAENQELVHTFTLQPREWGEEIRMTDEVIERVDEIWSRLGLPGGGRAIWRDRK